MPMVTDLIYFIRQRRFKDPNRSVLFISLKKLQKKRSFGMKVKHVIDYSDILKAFAIDIYWHLIFFKDSIISSVCEFICE